MSLFRYPLLAALMAASCIGNAQTVRGVDAHFSWFRYEGHSLEGLKPDAKHFVNPIVSGYAPDPSLTQVGKDYYLVTSSFAHFPGLPIYHSTDLVNWSQIGNAIDRPGQLDFRGLQVSDGMMAPDISYHDGIYYIVSTFRRNFVITASNPAGPWSDPYWLDFEGIDPSIFWNSEDGKAYIVNNGPPEGAARYPGHRVIWLQEFDPKTHKMTGERVPLVGGGEHPPSIFWAEGPHLFKRNGYYYLLTAAGGTKPNERHSELVFRSRSLKGPYEAYAGNPILSQLDLPAERKNPVESAGHAKLVQTPNGDWWAAFLAARPYAPQLYNTGRETFLLPVTWKDDWPTILPAGRALPLVVERPELPRGTKPTTPLNGDYGYTDEFDGPALKFGWMSIRSDGTPHHTLRNGDLVLHPSAPLGDPSAVPSFVGRKQAHAHAEASTSMRFAPAADGERAGLAAVQSDQSWLFFGIQQMDGSPMLVLAERDGEQAPRIGRVLASRKLPGTLAQPVRLKLAFDGGRVSATYALNDGRWESLEKDLDATFLSTKKAGGFVGTVIGLYNAVQP